MRARETFTDGADVSPVNSSRYFGEELSLRKQATGSRKGLANGQAFPSLGSRDKPAQNADGSTDLYLGPKAPEGKQGNWLATVPGRGYFAIVRLYGPTEPALNKSWKPGDIEKVK